MCRRLMGRLRIDIYAKNLETYFFVNIKCIDRDKPNVYSPPPIPTQSLDPYLLLTVK